MKSRRGTGVRIAATLLILFISSILAFALIWSLNTFADLTLDKIVIQLSLSLEGVSNDFYVSALIWILLPSLVIVVAVFMAFMKIKSWVHFNRVLACIAAVSVLVIGVTVWRAWNEFEAGSYLGNDYSDFIQDNYVAPDVVNLSFPDKKRI